MTMLRMTLILTGMAASMAMNSWAAGAEKLINPYSKDAGVAYTKLPAAKKGGTLYTRLMDNPKVLNPIFNHDWEPEAAIDLMFARLMEMDRATHDYFPFMAEKLEVSKDRKTMVFTLRKDLTWSDGTPITTDDAEFTYNSLMDPKSDTAEKRAYFGPFKFEKVDQYTFKLLVENPGINTLGNLNYDFKLIQKKQFAGVADLNKSRGLIEPVTSGPYKFKSFSRDQKVELERNKNWWGDKLPTMKGLYNFDSVVFRIISDNGLAYEKFIKGEIDILDINAETYGTRIRGSDKDKFGTHANSDKNFWAEHARTTSPSQWTYVGWNLRHPMFQSKKTRQALAMLIDYDQVINKFYYGEGARAASPFGSYTPNIAPGQLAKAFKFDPAKGLAMLKEDGWKEEAGEGVLSKTLDGKKVKFEFTLRYNSANTMRAKIAQMMKEQFKKAGIQINIQAMEYNSLQSEMQKHNFDAYIMGWAGGNLYSDIPQIWHSKSADNGGSNFVSYSNPEVDRLADLATKEFDVQKHYKIVQKVGAIIYDDQPYAFVVEIPGFMMAVSNKLKASKWYMKYDSAIPTQLYSAE